MCGIFAFLSKKDINQIFLEKLTREGMKCKMRGPDNTISRIINDNIFLLFHRLKINDTSDAGNQPLVHPEDFNLILICNGEIYNWKKLANENNFKTKSSSDCEIILHMYKKYGMKKTVESLDGVFAFVLVDLNINKTFIARDPIGVRSMYISKSTEGIGIASELKCLDTFADKNAIEQFSPGKFAEITNNLSINIDTYYDYIYDYIGDTSEDIIMTNIRTKLENAVNKRLLSDRPIGCLLSGGLDSSLITALVAKNFERGKLSTFSVGLEGSVDLKYARQVAEFLGTKHHEVIVTEEQMLEEIENDIKAIETYDTTTIRASTPMFLLCKYIKENTDITVIFSGEGADEASGSYMYFHNAPSKRDFYHETVRLMRDLHNFDVLRCDKSSASAGLEIRVPFLDKEFLDYYLGIDSKFKMPQNYSMEKYLLRKAFDNNLLPKEVLWRMKEAMSDGVSSQKRGWFQIIQEYVENKITDEEMLDSKSKYEKNVPQFKEALYYRKLFNKYFDRDDIIPYYWLPRWSGDVKDPSARVLNVYNADKSG